MKYEIGGLRDFGYERLIVMDRTMAQRRQAVIRLLDRNLKKEFLVGIVL